jgi:patatin-related protein
MATAAMVRAQRDENTKELRIGLVCYGGVSLCVYMHGYTKELQKLVIASEAFEADASRNPFAAERVEHVYWNALQRLSQIAPGNTRVRVVVDVVAGTSAGGINGVFLCKALAHNLSQDAIRELWFEKADIEQLLGGSWIAEHFNEEKFLFDHKAPFHGEALYGWILQALESMDAAPVPPPTGLPGAATPAAPTLVPGGHALQLFITATDYYGYRQYLTLADPAHLQERRNRHIMEFDFVADGTVVKDQFRHEYNPMLAFAARATSSFPGAFPPQTLATTAAKMESYGDPLRKVDWRGEFFARYREVGANPEHTCFIDGGVLNNYPFQPAIDAIMARRAETEVDRYLLFLDADPAGEVAEPDGTSLPNLFQAVWAGLTGVGNAQPILDQIVAVSQFNDKVRSTNRIIAAAKPGIAHRLQQGSFVDAEFRIASHLTEADLTDARHRIEKQAEQDAGYLYDAYVEIRVDAIVNQFAAGICASAGLDRTLNVGAQIGNIVERWASMSGYTGEHADACKRSWLLEHFDLGYLRRRLAFVIAGINELYAGGDAAGRSRSGLNQAKAFLYDAIDSVAALIGGAGVSAAVKASLAAVFRPAVIGAWIEEGDTTARVDEFVAAHRADLDALVVRLAAEFDAMRSRLATSLYSYFHDHTASWDAAARTEVLSRYIGFPFWDVLIYPINRLSQAGELKELQVYRCSPSDSRALGLGSAAEKLLGIKVAHFGGFFERAYRENDYLWGRIDAAERLLNLLWATCRQPDAPPTPVDPAILKAALATIVDEETAPPNPLQTDQGQELAADLRRRIAMLPG